MSVRKQDVELALRDGAWRSIADLRQMCGCSTTAEINQLASIIDVMVLSEHLIHNDERDLYSLPRTTISGASLEAEKINTAPAASPDPAPRARTAADLRDLLWDTIEGVRSGSVKESKAREISKLANSIVDLARVEMEHQEHVRKLGSDNAPAPMLLGRDG